LRRRVRMAHGSGS